MRYNCICKWLLGTIVQVLAESGACLWTADCKLARCLHSASVCGYSYVYAIESGTASALDVYVCVGSEGMAVCGPVLGGHPVLPRLFERGLRRLVRQA